jgi:hypothetical protein
MRNRGPVKLSLEKIGQSSFGDGLREAKIEDGVASFTFAPKMDGDKDQNYNRMFAAALIAVPLTLQHEKSARSIRFTAVDAADPSRKLLVYSLKKEAAENVDWAHGANPSMIRGLVQIEHELDEIKP